MRFYRAMLVVIVIALLILGLNTSNQGINRLTLEQRGPVLGLTLDDQAVNVQFLSKDYDISRDKLLIEMQEVGKGLNLLMERVKNHFIRIWVIFKAVIR